MRKLTFLVSLIVVVSLAFRAQADPTSQSTTEPASCNTSYPSGTFVGSATSKEAGHLQATLTLTCANGHYGGGMVTSAGAFTLTSATFDGTTLKLEFSTNGATGTVVATVSQERIDGTFVLGTDSGPIALQKTGALQPPSVPTLQLTPEQWHLELTELAHQLPALHPDAFHFITRADFGREVAQLGRALPHMNGDQAYFGLDRIATSIGDAHTYINFPPDDANLPIDIEQFGGDYRVIKAAAMNAVAVARESSRSTAYQWKPCGHVFFRSLLHRRPCCYATVVSKRS